ncbi:MAG: epimerase, partial [Bacteroidota bacterium]
SNVISLKHLISSLEKHLNKTAIIKKQPMQPGDVVNTYANIDKANKILGYNPTWKFEEGIQEFIKWKLS